MAWRGRNKFLLVLFILAGISLLCQLLTSSKVVTNQQIYSAVMVPPPSQGIKGSLSVLSYNLWNQMFLWEVRKLKIAQTINSLQPDLVALQEVLEFGGTQAKGQESNQMRQLQVLLPNYSHGSFMPSTVNKIPAEGLAILSKHPIISTTQIPLTIPLESPDRNPRQLLKVRVELAGVLVDFYVTHMSYDRNVQCHHAHQILDGLSKASRGVDNWIIAGDLNVYRDHEAPMEILQGTDMNLETRYPECVPAKEVIPHVDVWKAIHPSPTDLGLTFSNMPTPGLESRPDRILCHGESLQPRSASTLSGKEYQSEYYHEILKARAQAIMRNEACPFDCGPHGFCQCGVCVLGSGPACVHPCLMCQSTQEHVTTFITILAVCLVVSSLIAYQGLRRRRGWLSRLAFVAGPFATSLIVLYWWGSRTFAAELEILFNSLPEELNPSDHHALFAEFNVI